MTANRISTLINCQRGMGRSTPTHIRKECNFGEYGMDDASSDLDMTDEASIRAFAQVFNWIAGGIQISI